MPPNMKEGQVDQELTRGTTVYMLKKENQFFGVIDLQNFVTA